MSHDTTFNHIQTYFVESCRHDFCHYYASMSHALGIPDSCIMDAGGWKTDNALKTVYRHAMDDQKRKLQKHADFRKTKIPENP